MQQPPHLVAAGNNTGYFSVYLNHPGQPKPYQAQVWRGGKHAYLGSFANAEEAALSIARAVAGGAGGGVGCQQPSAQAGTQ